MANWADNKKFINEASEQNFSPAKWHTIDITQADQDDFLAFPQAQHSGFAAFFVHEVILAYFFLVHNLFNSTVNKVIYYHPLARTMHLLSKCLV